MANMTGQFSGSGSTQSGKRLRKILKLVDRPFRFGRHTLIFVHIPKCGGTSLHRTLEEIGGFRYRHLRGRREDLEGIEELDGIGGHQNFGSTPLHQSRDRLVYITVIRPPMERVLSFYRHVLDHPNHHLRQQMPELEKAEPLEFVERLLEVENYEISNLQTKMLTGRKGLSAEEAIAHVEANFSIVGLLDDERSYLDPLRTMFPRGPIRANSLNVSKPRELDPFITPALEALITESNGTDEEIFAHFASRHQEVMAKTITAD